jgi:hypothetical protein
MHGWVSYLQKPNHGKGTEHLTEIIQGNAHGSWLLIFYKLCQATLEIRIKWIILRIFRTYGQVGTSDRRKPIVCKVGKPEMRSGLTLTFLQETLDVSDCPAIPVYIRIA